MARAIGSGSWGLHRAASGRLAGWPRAWGAAAPSAWNVPRNPGAPGAALVRESLRCLALVSHRPRQGFKQSLEAEG